MKRNTLALLTILALTLTACGASASTEAATAPQTGGPNQTMSGLTLIVIGTLKLDGTEQAVTPEQAAELLPLWQVYKDLSSSDTAAQAEVDALVKQIEDTMTGEQMQAINSMGLTPQDMMTVMQELGLDMGRGQRPSGSGDTTQDGGGGFMPPGGGMPPDMGGGGAPGGGGGMPGDGGQGLSQDQIATAQAARGAGGGPVGDPNRVPTTLIDVIIEYLQTVAGS